MDLGGRAPRGKMDGTHTSLNSAEGHHRRDHRHHDHYSSVVLSIS